MNKFKKLFSIAALSTLFLAGCDVRAICPVGDSSSSSTSDTGSSSATVATDIFGNVLPDLNKEATNVHTYETISGKAQQEGSTQTYSGEVAGYWDGKNVAYGWAEYTVEEWSSTYGVAVKIAFDDNGKALSVQIGAPTAGAHNFTPMYAETDPDVYDEYLNELQNEVNALVVGRNAKDIAFDCCDFIIEPAAEDKSGQFIPSDGDLLPAGATQTETRTEAAVFAAAASWLYDHDGWVKATTTTGTDGKTSTTYDLPKDEINNALFSEVEADIKNETIPTSGTALTKGFKGTDGAYYSYIAYESWHNIYGVALKATVDDTNKITALEFGVPQEGAHNFTSSYAGTNFKTYIQYLKHYESDIKNFLLNKDLSTLDLKNTPVYNVDQGGEVNPGFLQSNVIAGATQSYTRGAVAVYSLVNAILAK